MRIGQAFPSKYLRAADLPEGVFVPVTIERVEMQNVAGNDQPEEDKPVLFFIGKTKGVVLNKTNATAISDVYGDDTDLWGGRQVKLYATTTAFQGKNVACIRIQVAKNQPTSSRPATSTPRVPSASPAAPAFTPPTATEYQGESTIPAGTDIPDDLPF